ncbi:MAG: glycosyltransferase, partial [Clostridiaceae bacterium]
LVDISTELEPDVSKYDIVHLFNITRIHETWLQCNNALKYNKPVVLSTIHHSKKEIHDYELKGLLGLPKLVKKIFSGENDIQLFKTGYYTIQSPKEIKAFLKQLQLGYIRQQIDVLKKSTILVPNSKMEMDKIQQEFDLQNLTYHIVPNGIEIDNNILCISEEDFVKKYGFEDFVFCVGRIEPRKNQLNIIKALEKTNIPVIFAGSINKKHRKYYKEVMNKIDENKNMHYVGLLDRELLYSGYKASKVTVLASWFETTGLVGLEGGIMDSNVVITEKGYTKEYYKNNVWYCEPNSVLSIKEAVLKAYNAKRGKYDLKNLALKFYTWEKAARETLKAYNIAIHIKNNNA